MLVSMSVSINMYIMCICFCISVCVTCTTRCKCLCSCNHVFLCVSMCQNMYLDLSLSLKRFRLCRQTRRRFECTHGFFSVPHRTTHRTTPTPHRSPHTAHHSQTDRDIDSGLSKSRNQWPPKTVNYVLCGCVLCCFVCMCLCGVVLVACARGVVCSGIANDWRNRERDVLDLLSNCRWVRSTMEGDP